MNLKIIIYVDYFVYLTFTQLDYYLSISVGS